MRSALGASRRSILGLVLRQGLTLAGLGIVFGMVGAMIASRALVTLLFGVSRLDSTTYIGVIACWWVCPPSPVGCPPGGRRVFLRLLR